MRSRPLAALAVPCLLAPACFWERLPSASTPPSCTEVFTIPAITASGMASQFGHYISMNDQYVAISGFDESQGSASAQIYIFQMSGTNSGLSQPIPSINGRNGFDIKKDTITYFPPANNINLEVKSTQITTSEIVVYGRAPNTNYYTDYGQTILSRHGRIFVSNNNNDIVSPPILELRAGRLEGLFGKASFPGSWGRPLLGSSKWLATGGQTESLRGDFQVSPLTTANVQNSWKSVSESVQSKNCTLSVAHNPDDNDKWLSAQPNAALSGDMLVAQETCNGDTHIVMFALAESGAQRLESPVLNTIPDILGASRLTLARDSEHEGSLTAIGALYEDSSAGTVWVTRISADAPGLATPTPLRSSKGAPSSNYGGGLAVSGSLVAVGDPTPTGGSVHIFRCQ